uniref:PX domain-containing protein n=1 Tax=Hyaloperonospora arabidopsidis (strain Emoy2) TaxID=559515 RepID=M4BVY2_HYAAE
MAGKLRVAIIGSQTRHPDTPMTYTVYRTSVNYQGLCYHRLIRYRQFRYFAKHLELSSDSAPISAKFPPKIWWSRKASIRPEVVEVRQVLLNEFMQQVCTRPLTTQSKERLLKMLQVGKFAPQEEKDRVVDSRLGSEQQSVTIREHTSDEQDYNHLFSLRKDEVSNYSEEGQSEASRNEEIYTGRANQVRNETEDRPAQRPNNCSSADMNTTPNCFVPASLPLKSQHTKCVMFGANGDADGLTYNDEDINSTSSSSESVPSPERYYSDQIKQRMASIENIVDSVCAVELQVLRMGKSDRPDRVRQK